MSHRHTPVAVGKLRFAFALCAGVLVAEVAGGVASHSLGLMADAGHLLTDLFALGLAWFAAEQATRPADARRTYGYHRLGILVALLNAVTLVVIAIFIAFEAYHRLIGNEQEVNGALMLGVAALALVVNALVAFSLAGVGQSNLNVKSALLHVIGDAAASAGVLAAGAVIAVTGLYELDPIASLAIAALICVGAWRIIGQAVGILMESAPPGLNVAEVVRQILIVPGIKDVHDLHVWSISSEMTALSCHVLMEDRPMSDVGVTLASIKDILRRRFGVGHATIEVECEGCVTDNAFCSVEELPHPAEGSHAGHDH